MKIHIISSTASATTGLSAFDKALYNAGIANYNLIRLSSIIPAETQIITHQTQIPKEELLGKWGDRLYVVMAEARVITPNVEAWAGIGWVQDKVSGEGLFVEHEGYSEGTIRGDIKDSLESMISYREDHEFGEINMRVCGITCETHPVSALVIAVYQASDWDNKAHLSA